MRKLIALATVVALLVTPTAGSRAQTPGPEAIPVPSEAPVTTEPAETPALAAPAGPTVTYTVRESTPTLIFNRSSAGGFGLISGVLSVTEGKRMAADYKLEEPANALGAEVAAAWAASKNGSVVEPIAVRDGTNLFAANGGKADYIVDVAPVGATVTYFSLDWWRYGVFYGTTARVIDARTRAVVGTAKCWVDAKKTPTSPKYDELVGNGGEGVRRIIQEANVTCAAELNRSMKRPKPGRDGAPEAPPPPEEGSNAQPKPAA